MSNKEFKIQSKSLNIGGAEISVTNNNKVVVPGITQPTAYTVTEVVKNSTGDIIRYPFYDGAPKIYDNVAYTSVANGANNFVEKATYSATMNGNYIAKINVVSGGSYTLEEATDYQMTHSMWAYSGPNQDPLHQTFNYLDWQQIYYSPVFSPVSSIVEDGLVTEQYTGTLDTALVLIGSFLVNGAQNGGNIDIVGDVTSQLTGAAAVRFETDTSNTYIDISGPITFNKGHTYIPVVNYEGDYAGTHVSIYAAHTSIQGLVPGENVTIEAQGPYAVINAVVPTPPNLGDITFVNNKVIGVNNSLILKSEPDAGYNNLYGAELFYSVDNDTHLQPLDRNKGIALGFSYSSGASHIRVEGRNGQGNVQNSGDKVAIHAGRDRIDDVYYANSDFFIDEIPTGGSYPVTSLRKIYQDQSILELEIFVPNLNYPPSAFKQYLLSKPVNTDVIITFYTTDSNTHYYVDGTLSQTFQSLGMIDAQANLALAARVTATTHTELLVGDLTLVSINFPTYTARSAEWTFENNGQLVLPTTSAQVPQITAGGDIVIGPNSTAKWMFKTSGELGLPAGSITGYSDYESGTTFTVVRGVEGYNFSAYGTINLLNKAPFNTIQAGWTIVLSDGVPRTVSSASVHQNGYYEVTIDGYSIPNSVEPYPVTVYSSDYVAAYNNVIVRSTPKSHVGEEIIVDTLNDGGTWDNLAESSGAVIAWSPTRAHIQNGWTWQTTNGNYSGTVGNVIVDGQNTISFSLHILKDNNLSGIPLFPMIFRSPDYKPSIPAEVKLEAGNYTWDFKDDGNITIKNSNAPDVGALEDAYNSQLALLELIFAEAENTTQFYPWYATLPVSYKTYDELVAHPADMFNGDRPSNLLPAAQTTRDAWYAWQEALSADKLTVKPSDTAAVTFNGDGSVMLADSGNITGYTNLTGLQSAYQSWQASEGVWRAAVNEIALDPNFPQTTNTRYRSYPWSNVPGHLAMSVLTQSWAKQNVNNYSSGSAEESLARLGYVAISVSAYNQLRAAASICKSRYDTWRALHDSVKISVADNTWEFSPTSGLILNGGPTNSAAINLDRGTGSVLISNGPLPDAQPAAPSDTFAIGGFGTNDAFSFSSYPAGIGDGNTWSFHRSGRTVLPFGVAPTHSYGALGDKAGMVTFDENYIYYCTDDYQGNMPWTIGWSNVTNQQGSPSKVIADVGDPALIGRGALQITNCYINGEYQTLTVVSYALVNGHYEFTMPTGFQYTMQNSELQAINLNIWVRTPWTQTSW